MFDDLGSCMFHEHLLQEQDQCLRRIYWNANIFPSIIEACTKDGLTMSMELD
jgi:hypothetical protein